MLAKWVLNGAAYIGALNLPGVGAIQLDPVVLGFAIAISALTGISFGLFPSLQVSQPHLADELRESGTASGLSSSRQMFAVSTRGLLVIGQVAFSIVLLIGAALLLKSFLRLQSVDPGFEATHLLTAKITLPPARYDTAQKKLAFINELTGRLNAIPAVHGSAVAMSLPSTAWLRTNIQIAGMPWETDPADWPSVQIQSVTPGYFHTLGIAVERGREFTERDNSFGAPPAIIVNESFARRFWPTYPRGIDPVGQYMREGADRTPWVQIVGIVSNVREGGLAMDALPEFYVPTTIHPPQTAYLAARTSADPLSFVGAVRKQVQSIDRDEPLSEIRTMDQVLSSRLGQRRVTMLLLSSFAGMALLLAVIGMYGTIAYSVAQRTQEARRSASARRAAE